MYQYSYFWKQYVEIKLNISIKPEKNKDVFKLDFQNCPISKNQSFKILSNVLTK